MTDTVARPASTRFLEALRPSVMGPRLAPIGMADRTVVPIATWGSGRRSCHVLDAKFEPGVRAIVLYEQAGRLFRGDLVDVGPGPDGAALVDPGVAVWPFPHDPELPSLPRAADPTQLGPALASAMGSAWSRIDGHTGSQLRITVLRYRPGKRATFLVTHAAAPPLIVKAYHNPVKAAAVVDEAPRLQGVTTSKGVLAFAPTRAFLAELSLVVQQPVAGNALDLLLGGPRGAGRGARDGLRRAARSLAELHDGPVITGRARAVEKELIRFRERAGRIATVEPALGGAADRLAERLMSTLRLLPPARLGTMHGDCKPSQFLIGPERVHLLDLDHCGVGDQAGDVGTFLATLRQHEIRDALAGRRGRRTGDAVTSGRYFVDEYLRHSATDREMVRIQWHEAVALERKALRAFARAPRSPLANALILEAEACLDDLMEAA